MHALTQHLAVLRSVLRRMFASKLGGLLNILVIGIALSLPAGMYVLLKNVQGLVEQLSGTPQISLFLAMDAKADNVDSLRQRLSSHPAVASVEFVARDRALEQLKRSTGLADVIGGLDRNPLPDAFIVSPKPDEAQSLDALRAELAKLPKVEQAQLDSAWAYKLEALLRFGRLAVLILASLLSLALIAVTFNTIRLQILTQRDEIEVSRLIGATDGFIRRPFLYFGALQGLLGGLAAWLIVSAGLWLLNRPLGELSQLYSSQFVLHPLSPGDSLSLLLFSLYLGWLGAWLSVARHLSQIER
ncbi:cell division protein FtsX [Ferrigenium kumadai]|uniref:Cell division protein FtsX n=2 Tax=Ferrigenium kumadai TaxID=1682490 RepID=A0AAN1SY37_9PROT|nr:permease-like cell division protein FtsX [Ferrigenium kumadai]BBI98812.1 cell division protein FtsX [Ferrigenium kumadai]